MPKDDPKTRNRVCILTINCNAMKPIINVPLCRNARNSSGVEFLVGFETEFILLKNTNPIEAVNRYGWSNAPALLSGTDEAKILEEIADALEMADIELQMYHSEAAPGQYEIVTGPLPPLQAADALIHTRETIYNIASKHGLRATLAPRVFSNSCMSLILASQYFIYPLSPSLQAAARHIPIFRSIHQNRPLIPQPMHI
jgi:Glutamine synthetase, catalytic domain